MSSESPSVPPLQFDTVVPVGGTAPSSQTAVVCGECQQQLLTEYYDVNTVPVCGSCRGRLEEMRTSPSGVGVMLRSALFGVAAAIAGAILYYAVVAITEFEIGLVAIAIGYMVGYAIRRGAKGRGGRRLQVLAIVLTYWAVGLAYTPLVMKAVFDAQTSDTLSRTSADASATAAQPDEDEPSAGLLVAVAYLVAMTVALPVMVVFGSLPGGAISALIIGIGMQQAWKMTAAPQLVITGPFQIASPASPVA